MIEDGVLDHVSPFDGLPGYARRRLASRAVRRGFRRGEFLWRAGEPTRGLWLLLAGAVDIVHARSGNGHVDLIHRVGAGGTMGEIPLLSGGGMPASGVAKQAGECVILHPSDVDAAVRTHPALAHWLLVRLAARGRVFAVRLGRIRGSTVMARLAEHLSECHDRSAGAPFRLGPRQRDVAEELGTSREVVVRYLSRLGRSGLIRGAGRGRWQVVDVAGLAAVASSGHAEPMRREVVGR